MDKRLEYEEIALDNIALDIGIGIAIDAPLGTAVWISKHGNEGDG